jgi:hypothetical protein
MRFSYQSDRSGVEIHRALLRRIAAGTTRPLSCCHRSCCRQEALAVSTVGALVLRRCGGDSGTGSGRERRCDVHGHGQRGVCEGRRS